MQPAPHTGRMARADFVTGLALVALAVYVLIESWRMPRLEHLKVHPLSVPGVVPGFLGVIIFIFGAILAGRSLRAGGQRLWLSVGSARAVLAKPGNQRLLITAFLAIGYAGFLLGTIPFWLGTGLFVFVFVVAFEWRRDMGARGCARLATAAGILAVATSAVVSWVFQNLFLVTLP